MNKRLLIVGSDQVWALERIYTKYLRQAGLEVELFAAPDDFHDWYKKSLLHKVLFRAGLAGIYRSINQRLLEKVRVFNPGAIWIFKGMEIFPATLHTLKEQGYFLANYNPDHPFIIAGRGSGNDNVTNSVGCYDLHFCYHGILQQQIEKKYKIPTVFLPFGYEISASDYENALTKEEINKICFIGNPDSNRIEIIHKIANKGIPVDVFGHGWDSTKLAGNPLITIHEAIYGTRFWAKLRQYRVQLNIFRTHNLGSHNMRSFEIPGIGGIQLSPFSDEQAGFFEEGKQIFFYRDEAELVAKLSDLLSLSPQEAENIRNSSHQRSLASGYSYAHRATTVYQTFKKYLNW